MVGVIISYFLDPACDKLQKHGLSRTMSSLLILALFLIIIYLFVVTLGPILYNQLLELASHIPDYLIYLNNWIRPIIDRLLQTFGFSLEEQYTNSDLIQTISSYVLGFSSKLVTNIWYSGIAIINIISLVFITPIVTFYLLRDWDCLVKKIANLFPPKHKKTIFQQFNLIDKALSGFIRGQTNVCIIQSIFYAISLSLVGLNFGFLIGFLTGLLAIIPYFGVFIGMLTGITVAFFQFGDTTNILSVLAIFLVGQFLEGNFITPKLVGDKVGLHPAMIIFSLLAGGSLFGFIGILLAIPATSIIVIVFKFFLSKYFASKSYNN